MITVSSSPKRAMIGRRVCSSVRFCAASIHFGKIKLSSEMSGNSPKTFELVDRTGHAPTDLAFLYPFGRDEQRQQVDVQFVSKQQLSFSHLRGMEDRLRPRLKVVGCPRDNDPCRGGRRISGSRIGGLPTVRRE
jgi:hypothetical protein